MNKNEEVVFKNPFFQIRKTLKNENGVGSEYLPHDYYWVDVKGAVMVLAWNEKKELCLCKEWRLPVNNFVLGLPGGRMEEGESSLESAKRELREEAGLISDDWKWVGQMKPFPGMANESIDVWSAFAVQDLGSLHLDKGELIEPFWIDPKKIFSLSEAGIESEGNVSIALDGILAASLWMFDQKYPKFNQK